MLQKFWQSFGCLPCCLQDAGVQGEKCPTAEPRPATAEHPEITDQPGRVLVDLDLLVFTTTVPMNEDGEVFPFQADQGWTPSMRQSWVVPTVDGPPLDGTPSLVLSGFPGELSALVE